MKWNLRKAVQAYEHQRRSSLESHGGQKRLEDRRAKMAAKSPHVISAEGEIWKKSLS
jgi:hypothetical protein